MHPRFYSVRCTIDLPGQGLLTTSPRPSPTCPHPSKRDTGMARTLATCGDAHISRRTPKLHHRFCECTHRVDDPTKHGDKEDENVENNTKQNKTRNETKTGTHRLRLVVYASRALRWRSGRVATRLRVSDIGEDRSLRSGSGFVMAFLERRFVSTAHRVTDEPKARNAHLVNFGHMNTATKLGVEAGLEHGKGDVDAGRLLCTRVTSGEYNCQSATRSIGHGKRDSPGL